MVSENAVQKGWEETHDGAGEESTAERRVGDDLDAKLTGSFEETNLFILDVESERRVLDLDGGDRVNFVCTAEGVC